MNWLLTVCFIMPANLPLPKQQVNIYVFLRKGN